jgi:hypothetical protein
MLADVAQSIAVVEMAGQVEDDLAETLHAMAAHATGEAAARRLRLAEDATQGARAAARIGERLREQARRWTEHADMVRLNQAVDHAARVLVQLAREENEAADTLKALDRPNGSDRAARRQLAAEASAAARHARDLAQALRELAKTEMAGTQSGGPSAADPPDCPVLPETSRYQRRLAEIDRRLAELSQVSPKMPGDAPVPQAARDAEQHLQQAVDHMLAARQLAEEGARRAASAHDRVAMALERSVEARIGNVAERKRMAAFHRDAATADRRRAQEIHDRP